MTYADHLLTAEGATELRHLENRRATRQREAIRRASAERAEARREAEGESAHDRYLRLHGIDPATGRYAATGR